MPKRIRILLIATMIATLSMHAYAQDGEVLDLSNLFNADDLEGIADVEGGGEGNDAQATLDALEQREAEAQTPEAPAEPELPADLPDEDEPMEDAAPAPPPIRANPPGQGGLITNTFYDTDLRQAMQDIAMSVGRTIICTPDVSGFITCELQDATLDEALRLLLAGTGYSSMEKDGYILIYAADSTSPNFLEISETRIVRLNYVHPASAVNLLAPQLHEYIHTDETLKAGLLSVTAPPNIMQRIVDDLKKIDQPSRQVLLDVRVVIIEGQQLLNIGLKWDWPQLSAGAFSNNASNGWPWEVQIGYTPGSEFTNALNLTLDLLSQNDQAMVLANPQVMSIDGEESQIRVIREEYFEILTQGFYTSSQLEKVEAGTMLRITPRVAPNGDITMQISTEVSDVISRGANSLPVVTRRTTESRVRVENGGTAAIAGLVDNRVASAHVEVPGFSQIPLMGRAFKDDFNVNTSRQVAIFVTPNLVPEGDEELSGPGVQQRERFEPVGESFTDEIREALERMKPASEVQHETE